MFSHPHTLMVQGTTSDAGKSILVTALCRILARHNISVAPFKPQNMALNSAVAVGGEIGRAQAVQALACNLEPTVDMNPVLLKPNSETGSQVIVRGQAIGNMNAREYHQFKPQLLHKVVESYQKLSNNYQAVMVEGAGSPAEINLREFDIANMGFAEEVDCPVIIVADIDRGGVFAHLYGTYALLSPSEQQRVVGFVINRFRGDVSLLEPGLDWLTEKTSVPVLGVIPYLQNLHIEAEDSITSSQSENAVASNSDLLKVAILMYPRASNHTDFDVLRMHSQVDCEFIKDPSLFKGADLMVLPGSKSVRGDLQWLNDSGWMPVIQKHLRFGGKLLGICGGYQMLGEWVHDPEGVESNAGSSEGLNLLALQTTLTGNKTIKNISGTCMLNDATVNGYEIHAGITEGEALQQPLFTIADVKANGSTYTDGAVNNDNNVMGTYIHGVFDQAEMLQTFFNWVGNDVTQIFDYAEYRDQEINRLADEVEKVLSKDLLMRLLSLNSRETA